MKIALNLLHYIPGTLGGLETYAKNLLHDLRKIKKNNSVHIYIITSKKYEEEFTWCEDFSEIISVDVNVNNSAIRILFEQFYLGRIIKDYNIDILHSSGYTAPIYLNCNTIVTIHDINYKRIPKIIRKSHGWLRWIMVSIMGPLTLKYSDKIIVVSDYIKREIEVNFNIDNEKIEVIPNRPPADMAKTDKSAINLPKKIIGKYLLYVASWFPHKNHEVIFKALESMKNSNKNALPIVLAGLHLKSEKQIKELKDRIDSIEDQIYIINRYLSSSELAWLYSNSKIFLFPSLYEGFGIPILEAMSAGKPVVCSNLQPMIDIGGEAVIKFDPNKAEDLIATIEKLLNSPTLYQKHSKLSRNRYLELEDHTNDQEKRLAAVYYSML